MSKVNVLQIGKDDKGVKISDVTFPVKVVDMVKCLAFIEDVTQNDIILRAVDEYCKKNHMLINKYDRVKAEIQSRKRMKIKKTNGKEKKNEKR